MKYETQKEINALLSGGMEQLTVPQFDKAIHDLGYCLDTRRGFCFNYVNASNERTYCARSVSYTHIASGKGFAQVDAPRDTLPQLQELRRNNFVVTNGHIWEL